MSQILRELKSDLEKIDRAGLQTCVSVGLSLVIESCIRRLEGTTSTNNEILKLLRECSGRLQNARVSRRHLEIGRGSFLEIISETMKEKEKSIALNEAIERWRATNDSAILDSDNADAKSIPRSSSASSLTPVLSTTPFASPDVVCFNEDMPMTPSLAPHRGLQMPTKLNRLTSSEYPLFNRLNPDRSTDGDADGICILGSGMPQFKAPTPLNRSDRVVSFRNIEQKDSLSIPSLLFRTTSNMSTMSEEGTSLDGDQSLRTSSETSWRGDANDSDTQLLPSVFSSNIGNTTVPSEKGEETLRSEIREGRFVKPSIVVDRRPKPVTLQRGSPPISRVLDLETASSPQISKVKTRERSTSKDSTRSSSSEKKRKRSSSQGSAGEVGCSCKRSRCRKKYCLCFSNGVACEPSCRCQDCGNTPEDGLFTGQYLRQGCRCDNSRCRKKYCICFNAGKKCSPFCKCKNCENFPTPGAKSRDFKSSASNSATTSSHREMGGNEGGLLIDTSLADATDLKSLYRSETTSYSQTPLAKRVRLPYSEYSHVSSEVAAPGFGSPSLFVV